MELPVLNPTKPSRLRKSRLPSWLVKPLGSQDRIHELKTRFRGRELHTVCEEARCPNLGECWSAGTATFMILGGVCTRHCGFCSVEAGQPEPVDSREPAHVAEMVTHLKLRHAVITCVARDDLADGGASHFATTIEAIRQALPECRVEVLTTDFGLQRPSMERVCQSRPDVFNHNLETVERLSPRVRHRASYANSLEFLRRIKVFDSTLTTKSGIMLGLGEKDVEVEQALRDLHGAGCEIVTIGQYLQPSARNLPVASYVHPDRFKELEVFCRELGFKSVASGPFVRSSYHAGEMVR